MVPSIPAGESSSTIPGDQVEDGSTVSAVATDPSGNESDPATAIAGGSAIPDVLELETILKTEVSDSITVESEQFLNVLGVNQSVNNDLQTGSVFTIGDAPNKLQENSESIGEVKVELGDLSLLTVAKSYGVVLERKNEVTDEWEVYMSAPLTGTGVVASLGTQYALGAVDASNNYSVTFHGLPESDYRISTYVSESDLTQLLKDIELSHLGGEGTLLGQQNQQALLETVAQILNPDSPSTEALVNLLEDILEGVNVLTAPVSILLETILSLPVVKQTVGFVDLLVDSVVAPLVSSTLDVLRNVQAQITHSETYIEDATAEGNVLFNDFSGATDLTVLKIANSLVDETQNQELDVIADTPTKIMGKYGVLTITQDGGYSYKLNPETVTVGKTDVFTYTVQNGAVQQSTTLTINIDGGEVRFLTAQNDDVNLTLMVDPSIQEQALDSVTVVNVAYVGLGSVLELGAIDPANRFDISVSGDTKREMTFKASSGGVQVLTDFDLFIYKLNEISGDYELVHQEEKWFGVALLGGVSDELTYTFDEGQYIALLEPSSGVNALFGYTLETTQDLLLDYGNPTAVYGQAVGNVITDINLGAETKDNGPNLDVTYVISVDGKIVQDDQVSEGTVILGDYGSLTIYANGDYVYTANNTKIFNYGDVDSFEYTIYDPVIGQTSTAQLNITLDYIPSNQDINTVVAMLEVTPTTTTYANLSALNPITDGDDNTTSFGVVGLGLGDVVDANVIASKPGLDIKVQQGQIVDILFSATGGAVVGAGNISDLVIYRKNATTGQYELYYSNEGFLVVPLSVLGIPLGGIYNTPTTVTFAEGEYVAYLTTAGITAVGGSTLTAESATAYDYNHPSDYEGSVTGTLDIPAGNQLYLIEGQEIDVAGQVIEGQYGSLVVQADGSYTYTVDNTVESPNYGVIDTFSYITKDPSTGQTEVAILNVKLGTVDAKADTLNSSGEEFYTTVALTNEFDTVYFSESVDIDTNQNNVPAKGIWDPHYWTKDIDFTVADGVSKGLDFYFTGLLNITGVAGYEVQMSYVLSTVSTVDGNEVLTTVKSANSVGNPQAELSLTLQDIDPADYRLTLRIEEQVGSSISYGYDVKVYNQAVDQWGPVVTEDYSTHAITGNFLDNDLYPDDLRAQTIVKFSNKVLSLDPAKIAQEVIVYGQYGDLTVRTDGSFTYTPNGKGGGKEIFVYEIVSPTGDSDVSTIEINVGKDVIGSRTDDVVESSNTFDTFTMGEGSDTVIFSIFDLQDDLGGNGTDTWTDFTVGDTLTNPEADKIDISDLLVDFDGDLNNYLTTRNEDIDADGKFDTIISIDRDGADNSQYQSADLVVLKGVETDLTTLVNNQQFIV
ncbi:type I secretion C-terminal target domain-containing protein [Acinetobacter sp. YH12116]|uniref:BapA/Bap/LapF family large adhesin n=1 Tax=Acinetobacter sp. YH12116 TaxID=2601103 RepID=UPI001C556726